MNFNKNNMELSGLTSLLPTLPSTQKILTIPGALGGFVLGESLGGPTLGLIGAIAGALAILLTGILSSVILLKKQTIEGAVALDQERDKQMDRAATLHAAEVVFLREQIRTAATILQEQVQFAQRQVKYHEALELATRKRLHATIGEVQRCVTHITLVENECQEHGFQPRAFQMKSMADIVDAFPLPDAPKTSNSGQL